MISCPECNAEIAGSAFDCPKCGAQLKKAKRSVFGKIMLWLFILFNVVMVAIFITGLVGTASIEVDNNAQAAGRAIGAAIGAAGTIIIWVIGDIILGIFTLLTRPSRR